MLFAQRNIKILLLTIFSWASFGIYAQRQINLTPPKKVSLEAPYKGEEHRFFTYHYDINTNLRSNAISDLRFDNDGRLWICNNKSGIQMIDGYDMFIYGKSNGLKDRFSDLFVDSKGNLWAGGNGIGVFKLKPGLHADWYVNYGEDISDVHIQNFAEDSKGNIWVSTRRGGLTCFKEDTTLFITPENFEIMQSIKTKDLVIDQNDVVWFLEYDSNRILYYQQGGLHEFNYKQYDIQEVDWISGGQMNHQAIIHANNQLYTLTTEGCNLYEYDYLEKKPTAIKSVKYDREGNLHLISSRCIFKIEDGISVPIVLDRSELNISAIAFDENNSLWYGTSQDGIFYIPQKNIIRFPTYSQLKSNGDTRIVSDKNNVVMAAAMGKRKALKYKEVLYKMKSDERMTGSRTFEDGIYLKFGSDQLFFFDTIYQQDPERAQMNADYRALYHLGANQVAVSHDREALVGKKNGQLEPIGINCGNVKFFHQEDDRHYLWFENKREGRFNMGYLQDGNYHSVFDTINFCLYRDSLKLTTADVSVTSFHYLNDTSFLVGTWGAYMFKITPNTCQSMTKGFGSGIVYGYTEDTGGNLWIGGIEGGLNYVDGQSLSVINISESDGLLGAAARNLYRLENGDIAVGTNLGVGYFNLVDPDLIVKDKADFENKYELTFYGPKDGLIGQNFGATTVDSYGRVWVINNAKTPQAIELNEKPHPPRYLLFEEISTVGEDNEKSYQFFRTPGVAYNAPTRLSTAYSEKIHISAKAIYFKNTFDLKYQWRLDQANWSIPQNSHEFVLSGLPNGQHEIHFRAITPDDQKSNVITLKVDISAPFYQTAWFIILVILSLIGIIYIVIRWRTHVLRQRQQELEQTVEERTEEINIAKVEIETQHNEIKDSINYAKRIQEAILPASSIIQKCLPNSFIMYEPKDVVAGDFYWLEDLDDTVVFAAADCTGHGVPGAMVSVVCHNALNRSVREFDLTKPNEILDKTRELVLEKFESGQREVSDGMDIAVCVWNKKTNKLQYAGANNSLYHLRKDQLNEVKADKQPIGKFHDPKPFTMHELKLEAGDAFYIFTDGYVDQFGGEKGKKFKSSHFKKLLQQIFQKDLETQQQIVQEAFQQWKGELEQIDDVCVIGVRV